jgi:hypothetical protein
MLKTSHFSSHFNFDFGARSRDYGYRPKSVSDIKQWYRSSISLAAEVCLSTAPAADDAKRIIAENFRGLWNRAGIKNELEALCCKIGGNSFWREGWIALRQTIFFDAKDHSTPNARRLIALEKSLCPSGLAQEVRSRVLIPQASIYDFDEIDDETDFGKSRAKATIGIESLGEKVAANETVLQELLPELLSGEGELWHFGMGLARGSHDPKLLWNRLTVQLAKTPENTRNVNVFRGFVNELQRIAPSLTTELLDKSVVCAPLSVFFPALQTAVAIDERGAERLLQSLNVGRAPISVYANLAIGSVSNSLDGATLAKILLAISEKIDGYPVAAEILYIRMYVDDREKRKFPHELIAVGRELLQQVAFTKRNPREARGLGTIAKVCLVGEGGALIAKELCRKLQLAITQQGTAARDHDDILKGLLVAQPIATLDELFDADNESIRHRIRMIRDISRLKRNPLSAVSDETLIEWCNKDPRKRYPILAAVVTPFHRPAEKAPLQWTEIATRLVQNAPDAVAVLVEFCARFRPMSWTGSRATEIESNAKLLDQVDVSNNVALANFILLEKERLAAEIARDKAWEERIDKNRDERFE